MPKIVTTPAFRKDRSGVSEDTEERLERVFDLLRDHPFPDELDIKKLKGYQRKIFRIRVGDYRLIYTFEDGQVVLLGIDNRKDVYQ